MKPIHAQCCGGKCGRPPERCLGYKGIAPGGLASMAADRGPDEPATRGTAGLLRFVCLVLLAGIIVLAAKGCAEEGRRVPPEWYPILNIEPELDDKGLPKPLRVDAETFGEYKARVVKVLEQRAAAEAVKGETEKANLKESQERKRQDQALQADAKRGEATRKLADAKAARDLAVRAADEKFTADSSLLAADLDAGLLALQRQSLGSEEGYAAKLNAINERTATARQKFSEQAGNADSRWAAEERRGQAAEAHNDQLIDAGVQGGGVLLPLLGLGSFAGIAGTIVQTVRRKRAVAGHTEDEEGLRQVLESLNKVAVENPEMAKPVLLKLAKDSDDPDAAAIMKIAKRDDLTALVDVMRGMTFGRMAA